MCQMEKIIYEVDDWNKIYEMKIKKLINNVRKKKSCNNRINLILDKCSM